jgi:rfaE bifunctional protein nucleotidyltransferase chain/domain
MSETPQTFRNRIESKIMNKTTLGRQLLVWDFRRAKIVFTNGCFDLLHDGHLDLLIKAKEAGDKLIVGLNSDASVKRLKGETRPVKNESSRAMQLAALQMVDAVILFEEDTPQSLIEWLQPDVLVKGGDYDAHSIVGADIVTAKGGEVLIVPTVEGFSTSGLIQQMKS